MPYGDGLGAEQADRAGHAGHGRSAMIVPSAADQRP